MKETPHEAQWKRRIRVAGGGVFFLVLGFILQHAGKLQWTNYFGQNIFSVGVIVVGALIIASALLPNSWVARLAAVEKKRPIRFHHDSTRRQGKD